MDAWYVDHRGLVLDLKILALTALRVLQRKDVHLGPSTSLQHDLDVERQMEARNGGPDGPPEPAARGAVPRPPARHGTERTASTC